MFFKSVVFFFGYIFLSVSISSLQALEEESAGGIIQVARYRDLDRDQKDSLVKKAMQIKTEKANAEDLGWNLCSLYLQEFQRNFRQFEKFLKSRRMIKFVSKNPSHRLELSAVAVERSALFQAQADVTKDIEESPFYVRLCEVFGDNRPFFQMTLNDLVTKAWEKSKKKTQKNLSPS